MFKIGLSIRCDSYCIYQPKKQNAFTSFRPEPNTLKCWMDLKTHCLVHMVAFFHKLALFREWDFTTTKA